jgi:hypothetical protein
MYNVLMRWSTGEQTWEPTKIVSQDDPVTLAIYAKEKGLLDTPGWQKYKSIAN